MSQVVMVDFHKGLAFTDGQRWLRITAWIDQFGDRTGDFDEAVRFVATAGDAVFVGQVSDWTHLTIH